MSNLTNSNHNYKFSPRYTFIVNLLFLTFGSLFMGYANNTIHVLIVCYLFGAFGYFVTKNVFTVDDLEATGFLLNYSLVIFCSGILQLYSLHNFGTIQTTNDAVGFYETILQHPPYYSWNELETTVNSYGLFLSRGAPLAILIWQTIYRILALLGIDHGLYIGIAVNAFTVAMSCSLTIATARIIHGNYHYNLKRVYYQYALGGATFLFGSIFLRDSFVLLLNSLFLWRIAIANSRRTRFSYFLLLATFFLCSIAGYHLREKAVHMNTILLVVFILVIGTETSLKNGGVVPIIIVFGLVLAFGPDFLNLGNNILNQANISQSEYTLHLIESHSKDSLGVKYIVQQSGIIRVIIGTLVLMIYPIPIGLGFIPGSTEYSILRTYNGIYNIYLLPMVLMGIISIMRIRHKALRSRSIHLTLVLYLITCSAAVTLTSLEGRHLFQYFPILLLVASYYNKANQSLRNTYGNLKLLWFLSLLSIHVAWVLFKL